MNPLKKEKGTITLTYEEYGSLYTAIEQLCYYKDAEPNRAFDYVQMACSLSQEEIKPLVAVFEKLKQM
jgi:hypothetical protein